MVWVAIRGVGLPAQACDEDRVVTMCAERVGRVKIVRVAADGPSLTTKVVPAIMNLAGRRTGPVVMVPQLAVVTCWSTIFVDNESVTILEGQFQRNYGIFPVLPVDFKRMSPAGVCLFSRH